MGVVYRAGRRRRPGGIWRAQVERYSGHLRTISGGDDAKVLVTLSTIAGALVIARGLGPTERSDELLSAVRDAIRERRSVAG